MQSLCSAQLVALCSPREVDVRSTKAVDNSIQETVADFGMFDSAANFAGIVEGDGDTTVQTIISQP